MSQDAKPMINTETLTWEATEALLKLDAGFVGTEHYMGMAYFWNHEYRYPMRDASYHTRKIVHGRLLEMGIEVNGQSPAHDKVFEWAFNRTYNNRETYEQCSRV